MKRALTSSGVCLLMLFMTNLVLAKGKKPKPGPLTGTWECMAHGGPRGDLPFTLSLQQHKENVTGSVSSPLGSTEIASSSFKKKTVEIHIDSSQANYVLTGKFSKKPDHRRVVHRHSSKRHVGRKQIDFNPLV